jgi:dTDP-4-amino-4,6-dideoxygalactose transaminase
MEQLNEAVKSGEITVDEMVAEFRKHLEATYGSQTVA